MLRKTHLVLALAAGLYFIPYVNNDIIFILVVLVSSLLPDIDSKFSRFGSMKIFRPAQAFVTHRGILHTYTLCIAASIVLALFFPVLALPFFLGYSSHLFADSFTPDGIRPFWPFKGTSKGFVKTGGRIEKLVFWGAVGFDIILAIIIVAIFYV